VSGGDVQADARSRSVHTVSGEYVFDGDSGYVEQYLSGLHSKCRVADGKQYFKSVFV
jgi:hypothetical protein